MNTKEIEKWSDRYFQICLALINRSAFTPHGSTVPVNIRDVVAKADKMIEVLQERDKKFFTKSENE